MPQHLPEPPSSVTGPLRDYLQRVRDIVNLQPFWSFASLADPNSIVTGKVGDHFLNIGPGAVSPSSSRVWLKEGPDDGTRSTTSWNAIKI